MFLYCRKRDYWRKILSMFLTAAIVFTNLLLPIPGNAAEAKAEKRFQTETKIGKEIISQRTRNSKSFLNEDGRTVTCQVYQGPIHYLDEQNKWQDINNELIQTNKKGFRYENKANEFKVFFSEFSGEENFIRFQIDKKTVDFKPVAAKHVKKEFKKNKAKDRAIEKATDSPINNQEGITEDIEKGISQKTEKVKKVSAIKDRKAELNNILNYEEIFSNVDFSYTVTETMLKEDITVHEYTYHNTFTFEVNLDNLYMEKTDHENRILIKEAGTDKIVAVFLAPFMKDAKGLVSKNLALEFREEDNKTYIDVIADEEWLKDEKRQYPVVIDPVFYYAGTNSKEGIVSSYYHDYSFWEEWWFNGRLDAGKNYIYEGFDPDFEYYMTLGEPPLISDPNGDNKEAYLYFDLPQLPACAQIAGTYLSMTGDLWCVYSHPNKIDVHRIMSPWDELEVTWDTKPQIGPVVASDYLENGQWGSYWIEYPWSSYQYRIDCYQNGTYTADITSLFRQWYQGECPNYGLALTGDGAVAKFKSSRCADPSKRPMIFILYTLDLLGFENNWGFTEELTNVYNGNLLEQAVDMFVPGRGEEINITRTYNSRSNQTGLFGKGWTSNLEVRLEDIDQGAAIFLYDADGTEHVFLLNYLCEFYWDYVSETLPDSGTGSVRNKLSRILIDNTYALSQNDGTITTFNSSGRIIKVSDKNGNKTIYNYNTGTGKLESITDPSGRTITFSYNANGCIDQATDSTGKTVLYSYDGNNRLIAVLDQEGNTVAYEYNSDNNLTKITYPRGNSIIYVYDDQDRVTTITRVITVNGMPTSSTSVITYDPANYCTTLTDANGHIISYGYDYKGNLVKVVQDPDGVNYRTLINYTSDTHKFKSVADPNTVASGGGVSYEINYDEEGRIESTTNPLNESTAIGLYFGLTSITTNDTGFAYSTDYKGNIINTFNVLKQASTVKYDQYGNIIQETNKPVGSANRITNASFEDGFTDWILSMESGSNATKVISSDISKFGKKSLEISNPTGWIEYINNYPLIYYPTEAYTLSGYVKTSSLSSNAAHLKIKCYNSSIDFLGEVESLHVKSADDWTRINLVLSPDQVPAGTAIIIPALAMEPASGTAFFDGIQFDAGANLRSYSYLNNSGFKDVNGDNIPDGWTVYGSWEIEQNGFLGHNNVFIKNIDTFSDNYLSQHIDLSLPANSDLTLSGQSWAAVILENDGFYGLRAIVEYTDNTSETFDIDFKKEIFGKWEQTVGNIHLAKAAAGITIQCRYDNIIGQARFNNICLQEGKNITEIQYDTQGNYPVSVTNALGESVGLQYDTGGNLTQITDPAGKTTTFGYDNLNRITSVSGVLGNNAQYTYDGNGNLTTATDPNNHTFSYGYNEIDALASITDPLNNSTSFSYDKTGNLKGISYPSGNTINFEYNAVDRLEEIKYNGNTRYTYEYDPNGNCTEMTDEETNQTTTFEYNPVNALTKVTKTGIHQIDYAYGSGGRLTGITGQIGSFGYNANYTYDKLGRVRKITGNGTTAEYLYGEDNQIVSAKLGDGSYALYSYDDIGQLKKLVNYRPDGTILSSYSYTYDTRGNITSVATLEGTINYQYDDLSRLTRETLLDGTIIAYSYDAAGNRLTKEIIQGDATHAEISDDHRDFIYDAANRLIEVKNPDGTTLAAYTYDALGRRSSMTTGGSTVNFHYSGNKVICETDANNNLLAWYNYDGCGNLISMTRNGSTYYYHYNGHGDVIALTDTNGNTAATYQYDAFGNIINSTGTVNNPYRYAGYRYDEATGLYYLNSRYYNPETGRFTTADTFHGFADNPQSLNLYTYCYNNPVSYVDPRGFSPESP